VCDHWNTFAGKGKLPEPIWPKQLQNEAMIELQTFRDFALSLPETDEAPHFENRAFRVKKKIFATLNATQHRATLKFSPEMQDIFSNISKGAIFPVPNKWGNHGWTHLNLETAEWELCQDALRMAWWEVAPKAFRAKYPEVNAE
jgi:predicted DNA-binding protein (MmcQ/YjbR family)